MNRLAAWWRGLTGPAKFRLYTRLSLQGGIVVAVVSIASSGTDVWPIVGIAVAGAATIVAIEAQPELATWSTPSMARWALPAATVVLVSVWAVFAVVANVTDDPALLEAARGAGSGAAVLAMLAILPFVARTWPLVAAVSVATGLVFGAPSGDQLRTTGAVLLIGVFVVGLTHLTLWGLRMVDDIERTKDVEAELQLAEERLRFARDLHDVVGRSFSAIAVKSELAATLSRTGDADRATAEMNEVKAIAVESMEEMRTLVRGYRDIDLDGEVAGARSLLSSTGCTLVLEGDTSRVPADLHELAAWVVREGTTNIVKHSSATRAVLALGPVGMSLRNDGAATSVHGERSGLVGLAERLSARGATLDTTSSDGEFILEITWSTS